MRKYCFGSPKTKKIKLNMADPAVCHLSEEQLKKIVFNRSKVQEKLSKNKNRWKAISPPVVKCVCSVTADSGYMIECESCSCWLHCKCVNISSSVASTFPFICPFCIKSSIIQLPSLSLFCYIRS